ncbi:MAG: RNA-binding protein [Actinomycetia bacterium]|nr:RNA-binding protein [Actinomycetes bacterium]
MLDDALEHLVQGIVSHPDEVRVRSRTMRTGRLLEVRVNPEDIGQVIGRQGRTATSLRTVMGALAGREQLRIDFVDVDRRPVRGRR